MMPSPVRWPFATATSPAPLVYEIFPAGPGKLLKELHTAESRQLVGEHVFEGEERRIETTDQMLVPGGMRWGFYKTEEVHSKGRVLEHALENGIAEDMGTA